MAVDRRSFLKIAGISAAVGLGAKPALDLLLGLPQAAAQAEKTPIIKGQRWAMVVDMQKLTEEDIRACIKACHEVHNVPDILTDDGAVDIKHEIKWIWHDEYHRVFPEQAGAYVNKELVEKDFLVLCNHCTNPPCVRVCPTQATFQRPDGIVAMDMHRCIGCRFCMAGCPYGSRSFNWGDPRLFLPDPLPNPAYPTRTKGVVEKCNFCPERLAEGKLPACVEASQSGALTFGDLEAPSSPVRELLRNKHAIRRKPSLGTGPNIYYIV